MKKGIITLLAIFTCCTLSVDAQNLPTDADIDGLHGRVKSVTKTIFEARTDFTGETTEGDILERLVTVYNSKGWRKTMTYITPEADVIFRSRFKHDGFGLTTVEQIVDNNEQVIGRTHYSYDANNVLKESWVEDADNQIESRTQVRFDAAGRLVQRSINDATGNIFKRETFTYSGNTVEKKLVFDRHGKKMQEWRYEYDDNNEPVSQTLYDYSESEPEMYITIFRYEYDDNGNWVRRTESELVDGNMVMQYIVKREIEYY